MAPYTLDQRACDIYNLWQLSTPLEPGHLVNNAECTAYRRKFEGPRARVAIPLPPFELGGAAMGPGTQSLNPEHKHPKSLNPKHQLLNHGHQPSNPRH